jgi:UDP-sugar pyrophosphorylase
VEKLDATYPGGLLTYVERAKQLMADYKNERQLFEGYTASVSHFL